MSYILFSKMETLCTEVRQLNPFDRMGLLASNGMVTVTVFSVQAGSVVFKCVSARVHVGRPALCGCGSCRVTSEPFLGRCSPYFLGEVLSLNLELIELTRLASQ